MTHCNMGCDVGVCHAAANGAPGLCGMTPSELTPLQQAAAKHFAEVLTAAIGTGRGAQDLRGLMLSEVAAQLKRRGQNYTARVIQNAADIYEGKR